MSMNVRKRDHIGSATDAVEEQEKDRDTSELAKRMKSYEERTNVVLDLAARPFVVRLDGNSFSNFTKPFVKPFDPQLHKAIVLAAGDALERFSASTAYVCSDEISLIFPFVHKDHDSLEQTKNKLFGGRIQKIVSLLAGYTSMRFNYHLMRSTMFSEEDWRERFKEHHMESYRYNAILRNRGREMADKTVESLMKGAEKSVFGGVATFDSRIFSLPSKEEVAMNIIWRSKCDCVRNSKSLLGTVFFKQKELNGIPADTVVKMLQEQHGVDWNEMPSTYKFGTYIKKEEYEKQGFNPITKETVVATRKRLNAKSFLIARNSPKLTADFLFAETWNEVSDDHPFWNTTVGMHDIGPI